MIYLLLGEGVEEVEAVATCDVLRRARLPVELVGIGGELIPGAHGISVAADITVEEINLNEMDMIVLPGGLGGVASIEGCDAAIAAVEYALSHDRYVAAICAAPTILGSGAGWTDGTRSVIPAVRKAWARRLCIRTKRPWWMGKSSPDGPPAQPLNLA